MKAIHLCRHARPDLACECIEVEDPGEPASGEVLVEILASAINPADLLIFEGRYPGPESLPAAVGIEGVGRVLAVGAGVEGFAPGDKVMSLGRSNWAERIKVAPDALIRLPAEIEVGQAAMLKANPPSAHLMLQDYVALEPGDWLVQNAANSAVGRHLIRFARARGLHSVNVVRRESLIEELEAHGADLVLVDGDDLGARVRERVGAEAAIRLGVDAIGGAACERLADCLSDGATLVNYGFLSGEPCRVTPTHLIVQGLTLKGFWLLKCMQARSRDQVQALYDEMAQAFIDGTLSVPIEASYGLDEIAEALAHANREARGGKILITPNGPLA